MSSKLKTCALVSKSQIKHSPTSFSLKRQKTLKLNIHTNETSGRSFPHTLLKGAPESQTWLVAAKGQPHLLALSYFTSSPSQKIFPKSRSKFSVPGEHRGKTQNWRRSDFHLSSLRQPGNLLPPRLPCLKGDHHKYCHPEGTPGGMA